MDVKHPMKFQLQNQNNYNNMSDRFKHRLHETESQRAVNVDGNSKIGLEQSNRTLPVGDLNRVLDVGEQFNNERQNSTCYRLSGTINPMFTNILFNSTGKNSFETLLVNTDFRDEGYPQLGLSYTGKRDLTYAGAIKKHLINQDGWMGYFDPNVTGKTICLFNDMEPSRKLFELSPQNKKKNWELTVTYPALSADTYMTQNGLLVIEATPVYIGNRPMVAFSTPVKHGLSQGDTVRIKGLNTAALDDDYIVVRIGQSNGDLIDYSFVIDVPHTTNITNNSRMIRMFSDEETQYYFRKFKRIGTATSSAMINNDYDMYPLKFSKSLFNDKNVQFVINEDIDISNTYDNLNRPLSELYLTLIKTNSDQNDKVGPNFTDIQSGIEMPFIGNTSSFPTRVPDIRRIHNGATSHTPLDNNVTISDNEFYGDVASYNKYDVKERILGEVRHRFNTPNREANLTISDPTGNETPINMGERQEGYFYKPHHLIRIREFSNYIEQGDVSTGGIPYYAEDLGDGRWLWRDLLDIGFSDVSNTPLDYPFLNGCHYIHRNYCFPVRRQDPFNKYGLYHIGFPRDSFGERTLDNFVIKKAQDAC